MVKHIITQNTQGINLEANNDNKIVSIFCNAADEVIVLTTQQASVNLNSKEGTILLKTNDIKISLDKSGSITLDNGNSNINIKGSDVNIHASNINIKGSNISMQGNISIKGNLSVA
ncbi:hypothetical protein [Francisella sp. SYW-9]|uniref:hypothetical protein n=1 Tax=Francisella sp. SYW-9 TaxID=2610888 RepID=UPI00123C7EEB|nr:hypothetical protein [Francisella sp. SYW-9]